MSVEILVARDTSWAERCAVTTVFFGSGLGIGTWAASVPTLRFRTAPLASRCWHLRRERSCRCRSRVCSRRNCAWRA